jgi:hypothetical protein
MKKKGFFLNEIFSTFCHKIPWSGSGSGLGLDPGIGKVGGKSWSRRSYKFTTPLPHHHSISQMLLHAEKMPEDYT